MKENLWRVACALSFVLLVAFAYSAAVTEFGLGIAVNPQSQAIADGICAEVGDYLDVQVAGVRVSAGIDMGDGYRSDTVVCDYTPNGTIPFMLFYDENGEFAGYQ